MRPDDDAGAVDFALYFAEQGLRILPIPARSKRPVLKDWPNQATDNPETILEWFDREPAGNYGILADGLLIVDVDPGKGGDAWLSAHEEDLPETWRHQTGSGGAHLLYLAPDGQAIGNRAGIAPGVDIRGVGGQIVGPGSIHPDGGAYEILTGPDDCPLCEAPPWLVRLALPPSTGSGHAQGGNGHDRSSDTLGSANAYAEAALADECKLVATAGEGTRNDRLFQAAANLGGLVGAGALGRGRVEMALTGAAQAAGLHHPEIAPTLKSGIERGIAEPRDLPEPRQPRQRKGNGAAPLGETRESRLQSRRNIADNWRPGLETFSPTRWEGTPPPLRRWIVPDWIPNGEVTLLSGHGGLGKSLLTLQLLVACATGTRWLDLDVEACPVLGVYCEDSPDEIHRRLDQIVTSLGLSMADLGNMHLMPRKGSDSVLAQIDKDTWQLEPTGVFDAIVNKALDIGARVIILDSRHDVYAGNENDRIMVRHFVNLLARGAMDIDGGVILTDHPSIEGLKSGSGLSGSTAWHNACRSRMQLLPEEGDEADPDNRILRKMKANYGPRDGELSLRWVSGVMTNQTQHRGDFVGQLRRDVACKVFCKLLRHLDQVQPNLRVSHKSQAGNYAPRVMAKLPAADREGFSFGDLEAAMTRMIGDGRLQIQEYEQNYRTREKLVINND